MKHMQYRLSTFSWSTSTLTATGHLRIKGELNNIILTVEQCPQFHHTHPLHGQAVITTNYIVSYSAAHNIIITIMITM